MVSCARLCPIAAALILSGCGSIGDPLPPSLNIPPRIEDLAVVERGDKLVLTFTIPALTTDGVPLRVRTVDLRVGPDVANWAEQAQRVPAGTNEPGPVRVEAAAQNWVGREIAAGVRLQARHGRSSDWSNLVRLRVVPPLAAPADLKAASDPKGVRLTWRAEPGQGVTYRIERKAPADKQLAPYAESKTASWVDETAQYGSPLEYTVQAVEQAGGAQAESLRSAPVSITPKDTFPPAVPAALTAVAAAGSIEVAWNPDTDPDLKGYYLYRSVDGRPFQRVAEVGAPSYSDRGVESGTHYRYEVSAVDQAGNESARSQPAEATAQ